MLVFVIKRYVGPPNVLNKSFLYYFTIVSYLTGRRLFKLESQSFKLRFLEKPGI